MSNESDIALAAAEAAAASAQTAGLAVEEAVSAATGVSASATSASASAESAAASAVIAQTMSNVALTIESLDADAASDFRIQQDERKPNTITPLAYGAIGDDTANDATALNDTFIAAAAFGATVDGRGLTYKTTAQVNLPAGTKFVNGNIHCTTAATKILNITGSDVTISDVSIIGRHGVATASTGEYGIYATGASAANPFRNIHINRVSLELTGFYGVWLKYVAGFSVTNCDIGDIGYSGVTTLSAWDGLIDGNRVDNVLAGFASNGYGIAISRDEVDSFVTDPRSHDIRVTNNLVRGVPWEGLDTHGGENIVFDHNTVIACKVGIAVGSVDGATAVIGGPRNVTVTNNIIDGRGVVGTSQPGISFTGGGGVLGTPIETGTGLIANNVVIAHGDPANNLNGAITLYDTSGVAVSGNYIYQPGYAGIMLYHDNYGFSVTGNTIVDPWSDTQSDPSAVHLRAGYNKGAVTGNVHRDAGTKAAATHKNYVGLRFSNTTNTVVASSGNHWQEAAFSSTGGTLTSSISVEHAYKTFNYPVSLPLGTQASPSLHFGDADSGFWSNGANDVALSIGGIQQMRWIADNVLIKDGYSLSLGTTLGLKIGTATSQRIGFWGATAVTRPTAVPVTIADVHAALVSIGLIS